MENFMPITHLKQKETPYALQAALGLDRRHDPNKRSYRITPVLYSAIDKNTLAGASGLSPPPRHKFSTLLNP